MQLDKNYIAIRERDMLDVFDLSLHIIRAFFGPLLATFAVGILPWAMFHFWYLDGFNLDQLEQDLAFEGAGWYFSVFFQSAFLVIALAPLATAPTTLYLGQAVFLEKPEPRRVLREWLASQPQLWLFQGTPFLIFLLAMYTDEIGFRVLLFIPAVIILCYRAGLRSYINEIILLERNPWMRRGKKKQKSKMSTFRRSQALHGPSSADLLARWLVSSVLAMALMVLLFVAFWVTKTWMTGNYSISWRTFFLFLLISMWTTVAFFSVVRFLSYLDLRIRREGWELELKMCAEESRLAGQLS